MSPSAFGGRGRSGLAVPLEEQGLSPLLLGQSQGPGTAGSTGMAVHPGPQCPGALPSLQPGIPRTLSASLI